MNNKYHYLLVMNRYVLFAVMVVISYGLCAQAPDKSKLLDSSSVNWTFSAEFKESSQHLYGFDDYTHWYPQYAYYLSPRIGKCDLPYISVKSGEIGKSDLNIKNNTSNLLLSISVDDSKIYNFTQYISCTSPISFNTTILSNQYDASMFAQAVNRIKAEMKIKCYPEIEKRIKIVHVNDTTGSPNFSCFTNQAMVKITPSYDSYTVSEIIVNGIPIQIASFLYWDINKLQALKDQYSQSINNIVDYDVIMFIIDGVIDIGANIAVGLGAPNPTYQNVCWVSRYASSRTYPHELGHCLSLKHRNSDYNALMCQDAYALGNNTQKLRESEWEDIR